MKSYEIRNMSDQELDKALEDTYKEIFSLRFKMSINQVKDTTRMRRLKKNVARLKTIARERELAVAE